MKRWLAPICAGVAAALIFSLLNSSAFDLFEVAYVFLVIPLLSVAGLCALVIYSIRKKRIPAAPILLILPIFWVTTWILLKNGNEFREREKWLFHSKAYKAQLLAQPSLEDGHLRHIYFDGWGFAGADTDVFLVFDPADSLNSAAQTGAIRRVNGIPCSFNRIWRLERQWYAVEFYTGQSWNECE